MSIHFKSRRKRFGRNDRVLGCLRQGDGIMLSRFRLLLGFSGVMDSDGEGNAEHRKTEQDNESPKEWGEVRRHVEHHIGNA